MKGFRLVLFLLLFISSSITSYSQKPISPQKGSVERNAMLDIFRKDFTNYNTKILFKVHHFLIQNGWACVSVTPLENNIEIAEPRWNLFQFTNGRWNKVEWSKGIQFEDDFELIDRPIQNSRISKIIVKKFPSCPMTIFPITL